MAYVNVAEWKTDQVCEWLKGLENSVLPYVHSFMNHGVSGQQLLSLRPEDLEHLGVLKLGHQEIILEAVEYLRNFHYELDRENLQLLALRLSCQAHSLHNELSRQTDSKPVTTQTLSDVASVIMAVKPLIRWLDRPPFSGQLEYNDKKAELMELSLEMATCAQRDRFAEKPIEKIRTICDQLAKLADYIIQDIADPMILQPASLDLATLKKRPGDDLGFNILPSFHGAHQIAEIKFGSVAHQCGKMEEGDEIVQVNYQTIVGWEQTNVHELFRESPAEILLTLKRRPRHTKIYGQIYIKPYRLPSNKKTSYTTRWQHNLPSPRPELLTIPDFTMPLPRHIPKNPSPEPTSILDTMATDSSDSDTEVEPPLSLKPRNLVQRRATITGASPTTKHGIDIEQFWKELKQEHRTTFQLRDKAASCAHGLDNVPSNLRPQTCLGIEQTKKRKKTDGQMTDKKVQFQEKASESETLQIDECRKPVNKTKEEVKSTQNPQEDFTISTEDSFNQVLQTTTNIINSNNLVDITVPLDECNNFINDRSSISKSAPNGKESNVRNIKERGKLDKSYSTPAYEFTDIGDRDQRKLMFVENPLCKLDLPSYCLGNSSSNNSTKTDVHSFTESSEDTKCLKIDMSKQEEFDVSSIITNANPAISSNEKYTQCNDTEDQECVFRVPEQLELAKTSVHTKINDVNCRNSIEENQSNNEFTTPDLKICNVSHTIDDTEFESVTKDLSFDDLADSCELNHESSEDKSESTSSYIEGTCSSSSEGDTSLKNFGKILQNIDCVLTENTKVIEKKVSAISIKENNDELNESALNDTSVSIEDNLQNIVRNIPKIKINSNMINDVKDIVLDFQEPVVHSCRYIEVPKVESVKKIETKSHLTPPEPPPRKYYTRIEAINVNVGSTLRMFENQEKHKASEISSTKKDFKKCEFSSDTLIKHNIEYQERNDNLDVCSNFVEKIDFIDGSSTLNNEQKSVTDTLTYSEINDKLLREEKSVCEKYEPFLEKFGSGSNQSTAEYYKPEQHFRNVDSPDGLTYSKQMQLADTKPKMTEKDKCFEKGVVNKAMMVARSIGLHGSLSKSSSNSPRSSRKRNMLLAKKRNVSVKDVGVGDLEGWLTYRSRGAGGAWARAWFVLKCSSLYRFKTQDSIKADCLIALTGFTVSQAAEVKSRKYAFKVYHTGTVFYFAADTEDYLIVWLDAINKATLGADTHNRNSGLFSETDESDGEHKNKSRNSQTQEYKANVEKSFGSLRKVTRKDSGFKDHEIGGASLDRKYLRFLGARNQNVPVPTAQFRSYRRVLPTSTPNKKQDSNSNSPDLQMTIAGSTFYGLSASQSATDMTNNSQDMGDYRRTTDRYFSSRSSRRSDDLQGFITLEEFMLSQQDEDQRQTAINRSISPRITPLINDHIHVQHRNFNDSNMSNEPTKYINDTSFKNGIVCTQAKSSNEVASNNSLYGSERNAESVHVSRQLSVDSSINKNENTGEYTSEKYCGKCKNSGHKKSLELNCMHKRRTQDSILPQTKQTDLNHRKSTTNEQRQSSSLSHSKSDIIRNHNKQGGMMYEHNLHAYTQGVQSVNSYETTKSHDYFTSKDVTNLSHEVKSMNKRLTKNDGYSGSSGNLISHVSSETLQRAKKDVSVSRKGSFNLTNRRDHSSSDKHWLDSLRRDRKSVNCDKNRLKNVAQYQPPPIPSVPFEQERMRAAFEMHLDKNEQVQKANRLKSLFGTKCYQKPCTLDLSKDTQKTLLGSPRLHRAFFRDKSNQSQRFSTRSGSQSPGDSGISQSLSSFSGNSPSQTLSQSFSSASSVSDWSPDTPTPNASKCGASHATCQKGFANPNRNTCTPPTLPYVPPPTSPPPDYPGLEYPPVFEPGTYSLSDASLLRNRNKNNQSIPQ